MLWTDNLNMTHMKKLNFIISLATFMCDRSTALLQLGHIISSWSAQNVAKTKILINSNDRLLVLMT